MGLGEAGDAAVRGIFEQLDTNNNGKLEFSEALGAIEKVKELVNMVKAGTAVAKQIRTLKERYFFYYYFFFQCY